MTPLKAGDKLYRVYGTEVQSIEVTRVTAVGAWFGYPRVLAFGCRSRMDLREAEQQPRSEDAAVRLFYQECRQEAEDANAKLRAATSFVEGQFPHLLPELEAPRAEKLHP